MSSSLPNGPIFAALVLSLMAQVLQADNEPDLILRGTLDRAHHETYQTQSFTVPVGVDRLTVVFEYDRSQGATVDLGLVDPDRFRGWSGGNKSTVVLTETYATPSYLPGPLAAGVWQLLLGVPNIPEGGSTDYLAKIHFESGVEAFTRPFTSVPADDRAGWYRGDLHLHSGHSDGSCGAQSGSKVPCPLDRTVNAAAERGLDFIALTEHNTRSHHQTLMALQSAYDRMVILPGRELTTFRGHANVFGSTGFIDFRQPVSDVLDEAVAVGGLVSINHPGLPSDERCMGCGWQAEVDFALVSAVEVVSGGGYAAAGNRVHSPVSGIPFWERLLNQGFRVTAIAGSDNHNPDAPRAQASSVGYPTTVVHAESLSQQDLLDGLRGGRVFIDVEGMQDRLLEVSARSGSQSADAGAVLNVVPGENVEVNVVISGLNLPQLTLVRDGRRLDVTPALRSSADRTIANYKLTGLVGRSWVRVEVTDPDGRVLLLSNPVYMKAVEN